LKTGIERQSHQIAVLELSLEHEARSAGEAVSLHRHPLDEVVIIGQEGFEIPLLPIARCAEPGPEVRRQATLAASDICAAMP
jgi:hypothetical protein